VERVVSLPADWLESGKDTIFIDLKQVPFPWTIRCFKEGDRFTPFGMSGRKKLKDLFIDNKITPASRKRVPLLICGGDIFWVGGVQMAEKARINGSSPDLLRLRMICDAPPDRH
jgi:tRNA(Ile)-lysidine synthase